MTRRKSFWIAVVLFILALLAIGLFGPNGCAMSHTCTQPTCMFCAPQSTERMFKYTTAPASTMPSGTIGVSYKVHKP